MWQKYYTPASLDEARHLLAEHQGQARIIAGATDLILEMERGQRPGIDTLIDITRIAGLDEIRLQGNQVQLGPLVTHNHCAGSELVVERAFALARACWEVGAPQIRNRGTVAGNLITASPANDSITPLMALGASLTLSSTSGERQVALADFYAGVRKTVMRPDELLTGIAFPLPAEGSRSTFIKLALRRAQAISVVNLAAVLSFDGPRVEHAALTLGAVAPTIIHAEAAEASLIGQTLNDRVISHAAELAAEAASPIDDLRGSADYRRQMVTVIGRRALQAMKAGTERQGYPSNPVMLRRPDSWHVASPAQSIPVHNGQTPIETTVNGRKMRFDSGHDKTLLRLLREEGHLIGTKEGCAEGECGACTILLDGMAVMACMVPAPRAHGAEIVTLEGLAANGKLHPIQQAFIDTGAVQCGYCTPGFLMSGAMLLEERPQPDHSAIQQAITGNLCRCTGYYKIVKAFEEAAAANAVGER
jgi:xanthine dehydrogenase iron-sulfur cluster and FAD-binding subunit A